MSTNQRAGRRFKIVVTDCRHHAYEEERSVLSEIGGEVMLCHCSRPEEVMKVVEDADGVLCDLAPMPAAVIRAMRKCRVIARYGVGCDNVDIQAATACGIWVANVPDYCMEEVSDHTLAFLLACVRKIPKLDQAVKQGRWNVGSQQPIVRLAGKVYGLVGYGLIARAVHRKLSGFNLDRVLVYDPYVDEPVIRSAGGIPTCLDELCRQADFISVHVPLSEQTRGLIGPAQLSLMKPTAILLNVARGAVVDEDGLVHALRNGGIHMAGLDVFRSEPPQSDCPLLTLDNVILSDHVAYYSTEALSELKTKAAANVAAVLSGGRPRYPVNCVEFRSN